MNPYPNPYMSPYGMQPNYQTFQSGPQMQVTKVNGENGARTFQMGANSSALLLDENGLMVWLVTSDGAGYKTVAAYDIVPHQEAPKPDWNELDTRIRKLEVMMHGGNTTDTAATRKKPTGNKADDSSD